MTPIIALFKKEFHQHGAFALAMIFMCLFLQIAYCMMTQFVAVPMNGEAFLLIAIIVTALYAGAATALAYSTEHADATYIFLRKMPISLATIAGGKIGWALCGTLLVLLGNLLLAVLWFVPLGMGINAGQMWSAWGIGIAEAFVWGLFWSPRCRSQVNALLIGYTCASGTAFSITFLYFTFVAQSSMDVTEMYSTTFPYRCAAVVIVGLLALRGAFRWFEFDTKSIADSRFSMFNVSWLRYPKRVQGPFFGLIHHHIRHTSLIYHLGILCMGVFALGTLAVCVLYVFYGNRWDFDRKITQPYMLYWVPGVVVCVAGIALFWATIFGHDQKNDSYRFLSRLGIHEGKVWWSRMLPATLCYLPVIVCVWGYFLLTFFGPYLYGNDWYWHGGRSWSPYDCFTLYALPSLQMTFTIWLIPLAVGAFLSISFRSQMVAIALSIGGMLTLLGWMYLGWMLFAASPIWTTVPICIALLVASRIRASYWLRETSTWRSRLIPLSFVFGTTLAVLIALPFVRIYSVPSISWEQIDAYFDQVQSPMVRSPEKRKALLQYIAQNNAIPAEYEQINEKLVKDWWKLEDIGDLTYEEILLLEYVQRRDFLTQPLEVMVSGKKKTTYLTRYTPWESARIDRALRLQIVAALVNESGLRDGRTNALTILCEKQAYNGSVFDNQVWWRDSLAMRVENRMSARRLNHVREAVEKWYVDHDHTLPESLDALVEASYLDEVPVHPFMKAAMTYHRNTPPPKEFSVPSYHYSYYGIEMSFHVLGRSPGETLEWKERQEYEKTFRKSGGTYLQLGKTVILLIEKEEMERIPE